MCVIDLTSTLAATIRYTQLTAKKSVNLKEDVITGIPCCFRLKRKQTYVFVFIILRPIDMTSDADMFCFIVNTIMLCNYGAQNEA